MDPMRLIIDALHCSGQFLTMEGVINEGDGISTLLLKSNREFCALQQENNASRFICRMTLAGLSELSFSVYNEKHKKIPDAAVETGCFMHVGNLLQSYAVVDGYLFVRTKEGMRIRPYTRLGCLGAHVSMVIRLVQTGAHRAALCQMLVPMLRLVYRKPVWLISDRMDRGGDNGEALYRSMIAHGPKDIKPVFAIAKTSPLFDELKEKGTVVNTRSFRYYLTFLLSQCIVSSQASESVRNPFGQWREQYANLLVRQKFVFLQHGVTQNDMSALFARRVIHADMICAATKAEHQDFLSGRYGYNAREARLTGFARYDRLYNQPEKIITVMPTWRRSLVTEPDPSTGMRSARPGFEKSAHVQGFCAWLKHQDFLQEVKRCGYQLQIVPHPNMVDIWRHMGLDSSIALLTDRPSYADLLAHSALLITDYSSVAFDFAYLKKPVLYYQYDRHETFDGSHTYGTECPDYERIGLGEVTYTPEELMQRVREYMADDCRMKPLYRERVEHTFRYFDQDNALRIVDAIKDVCADPAPVDNDPA